MQQIQSVVDAGVPGHALTNLVGLHGQRIEDRRQQLREDLDFYRGKLDELDLMDPQDCTGLRRIYRSHLERTAALLHATA
jgi:hypothetical protein